MANAGACVVPVRTPSGVEVTSDIPGNDGYVLFTQKEWNDFIGHVKLGHYDDTITETVTPPAPIPA